MFVHTEGLPVEARRGQAFRELLRDLRVNPGYVPAFVLVHLGCLLAVYTGVTWEALAVCVATYSVRAIGITAGYHRYFSHRSFKTSRTFQFVLALCGTMAVQRGVLWWASHHRKHHRLADQPGDIHSPRQSGFWWSHIGWFLSTDYEDTDWRRIRDFAQFPELLWLNRHYIIPPVLLAVGLYAAGGLLWLVWGFFISTTAAWHVTYAINSVAHRYGTRRYDTPDDSRNNALLALLAWGEGWHNNHHHYMRSARSGFFWWEIDLTYYALLAFARLGLVWDLILPPARVLVASVSTRDRLNA